MLTVLVSIIIKSDHLQAFTEATIEDVRASLKDPGVIHFELLRESEDTTHFMLHEVYDSRETGLQHLEMEHFKKWQSTIKSMVVEPPHAVAYEHILPRDHS